MDTSPITTSIIIVLYNGQSYIQICLAAIMGLDIPDMEVLVVDNGSTDGGPEQVTAHFPTVRLVRNPENAGFAAACNQGAALSRGEVLTFLNQDICVQPGWLACGRVCSMFHRLIGTYSTKRATSLGRLGAGRIKSSGILCDRFM